MTYDPDGDDPTTARPSSLRRAVPFLCVVPVAIAVLMGTTPMPTTLRYVLAFVALLCAAIVITNLLRRTS